MILYSSPTTKDMRQHDLWSQFESEVLADDPQAESFDDEHRLEMFIDWLEQDITAYDITNLARQCIWIGQRRIPAGWIRERKNPPKVHRHLSTE